AGRQEDLNNQARVLMSGLSTDLVQAQTSLTTPPTFYPDLVAGEHKEGLGNGAGSPTPIPPGVYVDPDTSSGTHSKTTPASSTHLGDTVPAPHPPASSSPGVKPPGLVLGSPGLPPPGSPASTLPPGPASMPGVGGPLPSSVSQPPPLSS